jgi:transposase
MPPRQIFAAIIYVLRTGCPWKGLPKEFGSASAIHQHFQNWHQAGFFVKLWQAGLAEYDAMEGIAWDWQSSLGPGMCRAQPNRSGEKKGASAACSPTGVASRSGSSAARLTSMT